MEAQERTIGNGKEAEAEAWAHVESTKKLAYEDIRCKCPEVDPALILADLIDRRTAKAILVGTFPVDDGPSREPGKNQLDAESITQLRLALGLKREPFEKNVAFVDQFPVMSKAKANPKRIYKECP